MDNRKKQLRDILIQHHKFALDVLSAADEDAKFMLAIIGIQTSNDMIGQLLDQLANESEEPQNDTKH